MNADIDHIGQRAEGQHGLVTGGDLDALGITRGRRRTLVARAVLVPIGRGAHRFAGSPRTTLQAVTTACLAIGGVATHRTAAALHGIEGFALDRPIEVLVPDRRRNPRSTLARLHTTTWLPDDDLVVVSTIPTTGVARTLFSLAALVPEISTDRVRDAIDAAVRDGLATDPWLWWRLEKLRCRGRNGVTVFEDLLQSRADGEVTESWLERQTLAILRAAGLPLPVCQQRIEAKGAFVARVDFFYELPRGRVVIEVSGHRHHRSRAQTTADAQRRRALTMAGCEVHEFTYDEIVRTPWVLVDTVRCILGLAVRAA